MNTIPFDISQLDPHIGMTDKELEALADNKYVNPGVAPWIHFAPELYSLGKCFRSAAKYPGFLPLYIFSDHGVTPRLDFYSTELTNSARVHLTWSPDIANNPKNHEAKKVIFIRHPWMSYRQKKNYQPLPDRKGTLVFFAHHVPGLEYVNHDISGYFEALKSLPEQYQPVTICMHMNDIHAGHHKEVRKYGLPIVTVGQQTSIFFVDRFYQLIQQFSYATSTSWGSQVAYCLEMGIPYFFMGEKPTLVNKSRNEFELGEIRPNEEFITNVEKLLTSKVDSVTPEQKAFAKSRLGFDSTITDQDLAKIIWKEFFHHWREWPKSIIPLFKGIMLQTIIKTGLYDLARKLWHKIKV